MTPALPPELYDRIIDFLYDNKSTLTSCSLVCHEWSSTSRYHLFQAITIKYPITLEQLTGFLDSVSPSVVDHVRELAVLGSNPCCSVMYDAQMHVTVRSIATCVAKLRALQALRLQGVWWKNSRDGSHTVNEDEQSDPLPRSCTLKRLEICKVFSTPHAISDTMRCFPGLKDLYTESVYWISPASTRLVQLSPTIFEATEPKLQSVTFGRGSSYNMLQHFLPVLQERIVISFLRHLSINLEHLDPCRGEARDFMACVAPRLISLHLRFVNSMAVSSGK